MCKYGTVQLKCDATRGLGGGRGGSEGETGEWSGNMVYPALLPLMSTPWLPVVDWNDTPADLNGLIHFAERQNLVSARAITFQLASTFRHKTKKGQRLPWHSCMLKDCIINTSRQWQKQKNSFTLYYTVDNWQFLQVGAPLSADSHFYSVNFSILHIQAVVFLQLL